MTGIGNYQKTAGAAFQLMSAIKETAARLRRRELHNGKLHNEVFGEQF